MRCRVNNGTVDGDDGVACVHRFLLLLGGSRDSRISRLQWSLMGCTKSIEELDGNIGLFVDVRRINFVSLIF